jgi:hypothetical protein
VASAGRDGIDPSRIPTGQHYERGFLVLSAGPTPPTPLEEWTFSTRSPSCEAAVVVLLVPAGRLHAHRTCDEEEQVVLNGKSP